MALLTKEERQALDKSARIMLRRERRAARKEARKSGDGVRLNLAALRERAAELMMDFAGELLPGPEKMDEVLDQLAEEGDDLLIWTWAGPIAGALLEFADGPAIRALIRLTIRPHVEKVYEELRDLGALD